jgi:DNA-directed RNA polymerase subunit RPC12/RpoP
MSIIKFHDKSQSRVSVMTVEDIISKESTFFHLNEWWNGEGFDLTIDKKGKSKTLSLTTEEMEGIIILFNDMIGVDEKEDEKEKIIENNKMIGCPECSVRNYFVYWDRYYHGDRNDFSNIITIDNGRCDDTDYVCPHCKKIIPFEKLIFCGE